MGVLAISVGAALCGGGAVAHFRERTRQNETLLALGGFCFLLIALVATRSGHF